MRSNFTAAIEPGSRKFQSFAEFVDPHSRPYLVSNFAECAVLIMTVALVIFFVIRYYLLESILIPRLYGSIYTSLNERARRGFINHHLAGFAKFSMLIICGYPYMMVMLKAASFHTPLHRGSCLSMGDMMVIIAQVFAAMYLHELIYRHELSIIAVLHHVGTVVITQVAITLTLVKAEWHLAGIEFMLCMTWGAFDVLFEGWVHGVIIIHRVHPDDHVKFRNWSRAACIGTGIGTFIETIVVMYLFGSYWDRWNVEFKVLTPILHLIFSAAQVWGTKNYWQMWQQANGRLGRSKRKDDEEARVEGKEENGLAPPSSGSQQSTEDSNKTGTKSSLNVV